MQTPSIAKDVVIPFFIALAITGCSKSTTSSTANSAKQSTVVSHVVDDRTVRAVIVGPASIKPEGTGVVVTTDAHKITVERERVSIDGVELVKLLPATKFLEMYLSEQGYFTMNADGAGIAVKQLPSDNPYKKQQIGGAIRLEGRIVHYSVFGDGVISPEGDTAVITTDVHKIVVERSRVVKDGEEIVKLEPTAKDVRISLTEDGRFNVHADGYTVPSK